MPKDKKTRYRPNKHRPLILVTNDDGVNFVGLHTLANVLKKFATVVIVAPDREQSATSQTLTLHRPLRVFTVSKNIYAVDGTPTDCVNIGVHHILKQKPDLVIAGINKGPNLGDDIHYSGTVSAAVEGGVLGIPSIAISVAAWENHNFKPAAAFALRLARKILKEGLPEDTILNVNIPNLPLNKIKGYAFTKKGHIDYGKIIQESSDPRGRKYFWICGNKAVYEKTPGSDCEAILNNKISITPLQTSMTSYPSLEKIKNWKF